MQSHIDYQVKKNQCTTSMLQNLGGGQLLNEEVPPRVLIKILLVYTPTRVILPMKKIKARLKNRNEREKEREKKSTNYIIKNASTTSNVCSKYINIIKCVHHTGMYTKHVFESQGGIG